MINQCEVTYIQKYGDISDTNIGTEEMNAMSEELRVLSFNLRVVTDEIEHNVNEEIDDVIKDEIDHDIKDVTEHSNKIEADTGNKIKMKTQPNNGQGAILLDTNNDKIYEKMENKKIINTNNDSTKITEFKETISVTQDDSDFHEIVNETFYVDEAVDITSVNNEDLRGNELNKMTIPQLQIIVKKYIDIISIESTLNDEEIKQHYNEQFCQKTNSDYVNTIMKLETWLQFEKWVVENKLNKLLPILKENDLISLSHLTNILKKESDVDDFIKNKLPNIKSIWAKKFKKVVLKTIIGKKRSNNDDITSMDKAKVKNGITIIPSIKREYIVPKLDVNEYAFRGGNGYNKHMVSILKTVRTLSNITITVEQTLPKFYAQENHKIILVCGKTGTGKTTVINSMMNYIHSIENKDKFRMKLIQEIKKAGGDADSQTDHITSYTIKAPINGNIEYDLTIIDTPGFGDCRGIEKDMQTVEEFKYIFENILNDIDGICFVVKSSDNRLDSNQTYVFNHILNLWAKNVAENIFILITFADGKKPNCIDALNANNVLKDCKHRFKLNNSAISRNPMDKDTENALNEKFWQMGMKCFKNFFDKLEQVKAKEIIESKQVLVRRAAIKTRIHSLVRQLDDALVTQKEIIDIQKKIRNERQRIDDGKEFEHKFIDEEYSITKLSCNKQIISCDNHDNNKCTHDNNNRENQTIHLSGNIINKMEEKENCNVCWCDYVIGMNEVQYVILKKASICLDCGCLCSIHEIADIYEKKTTKITKVLKDYEHTLKRYENKAKKNVKVINDHFKEFKVLNNELKSIALRPDLITVDEHIKKLIAVEENSLQRDPEKIKFLNELKIIEDYIAKLQSSDKHSADDFIAFHTNSNSNKL